MATHSNILVWRIPWTEETGGLQSTGSQSQTELSNFTSLHCTLDSFVDHDGYSISSKGFLPTVVDIMVI